MANFFDQFDEATPASSAKPAGNFFDQFDKTPAQAGAEATVAEMSPLQKLAVMAGQWTGEKVDSADKIDATRWLDAAGGKFDVQDVLLPGMLQDKLAKMQAAKKLGPDVVTAAAQQHIAEQTKRIQNDMQAYSALKSDSPWMAGATHLAGDVAESLLIPGGSVGKFSDMAMSGLGSGLQSYANSGGDPMQTALGAGVGVAGNALFTVAGKTINALRGRMKDLQTQAIVDAGKAAGVPVYLSDTMTSKPQYVQWIDNMLAGLPVIGNASGRAQQAAAGQAALQKLRDEYMAKVGANASDKMDAIFSKYVQGKAAADAAFDTVEKLSNAQNAVVTPTALNDLAISEQAKLAAGMKGNADLLSSGGIGSLNDMFEKFKNVGALSFSGARTLRSDIKDTIEKLSASGDKNQARLATQFLGALETDMEKSAQTNGGQLWAAFRKANDGYKKDVVPYNDFLKIMKSDAGDFADVELPKLLKDPIRARKLYDAAGPNGQDAIRMSMLDMALGDGQRSAAQVARMVTGMQQSFGKVFRGSENDKLQGALKLLRFSEKAQGILASQPTGMGAMKQTLSVGVPSAALGFVGAGAPGAAASAVGAAGLLRLAFGTTAGTRLIQAAAKPTNDKTLGSIWSGLQRVAERSQSILESGVAPPDDSDW